MNAFIESNSYFTIVDNVPAGAFDAGTRKINVNQPDTAGMSDTDKKAILTKWRDNAISIHVAVAFVPDTDTKIQQYAASAVIIEMQNYFRENFDRIAELDGKTIVLDFDSFVSRDKRTGIAANPVKTAEKQIGKITDNDELLRLRAVIEAQLKSMSTTNNKTTK